MLQRITRACYASVPQRVAQIDARQTQFMHQIDYYNNKYFAQSPCKLAFDDAQQARKIVSTRYIKSGEHILHSPARPYVMTLDAEHVGKNCEFCFAKIDEANDGVNCDSCNEMHYCSAHCKQAHAEMHHKYECDAFKRMHKLTKRVRFFYRKLNEITHYDEGKLDIIAKDSMSQVRLLVKIVANYARESKMSTSEKTALTLQYNDVERLFSHRRLIDNKVDKIIITEMQELVSTVLDSMHLKHLHLDTFDIVELACKQQVNSIGLAGLSKEKSIGFGLFPAASYFNHSCTPNCVMVEEPSFQVQFVALHDIPSYTELNFAYVPLNTTNERRKKQLKETYYFECKCADQYLQNIDMDYKKGHKHCNQAFLKLYQCSACHQGLTYKASPNAAERRCTHCGQIK